MIIEVACWAHGRRKFFEFAELQRAPVAIEAVKRIDALFATEREINCKSPAERRVRGWSIERCVPWSASCNSARAPSFGTPCPQP